MQIASGEKTAVSLKQVYRIASVARGKLAAAAQCPEHNLRLLVGNANFLDELTETIVNSPPEDERTSDKWADALDDLDHDSEGSDCDEDIDDNASIEGGLCIEDVSIEQLNAQNGNIRLGPSPSLLEAREPSALLSAITDMPELKRMKHAPNIQPIVEENLDDEAYATAQTVEMVPAALQALQTLQTLQIAEFDALIKITEVEVFADPEVPSDTGSIQLTSPPAVVAVT